MIGLAALIRGSTPISYKAHIHISLDVIFILGISN